MNLLVWSWILASILQIVPTAKRLPVELVLTSGETVSGDLTGFVPDGAVVEVDGQSRRFPFADLQRLSRAVPSDAIPPSVSAEIRGGSRLKIEGVRIEKDRATLLLRRTQPLQLPLSQLDWVRFREPTPATDPDWLGITGQAQTDDILVIRRSANAIDQAAGIVLGATDSQIQFDLGGNIVPAPVAKLEGVVFANRPPQSVSGTTVVDVWESRWAATSLSVGESSQSLLVVLDGDIRREIKLDELQTIRFADSALMLAELEPVATTYQPLINARIETEILNKWLGPASQDDRDLVLTSRSTATYRIDPDYSKFVALVKTDNRVEAGSGAAVRVKLGDTVVWEQLILPGDDAKGMELDVTSHSRLTLEVDFGEGDARGDAGDVIRFIGPRFTK